MQRLACPRDVIGGNRDLGTIGPKQARAVNRLQSCLGQTDGRGVDFNDTIIGLAPAFPDSIIGDAIGRAEIMDQVLDEVDFIA